MAFLIGTRPGKRRPGFRPARWIASLVSAVVSAAVCLSAQGDRPTEYQVKAAFLYNFAKFVEWPSRAFTDNGSPLVFCITGEDPFGETIDQTVAGRTVHNRRIAIRRLTHTDDPAGCHVLFASASEDRRAGPLLARLARGHMLTIGETEGFARAGGVINFYLDQAKVRFEINVRAAERAGLSISSHLLSLAKIVE